MRLVLAFTLLLTLCCGCADLSAVTRFAQTPIGAQTYRDLIADYTYSPLRRERYQAESSWATLRQVHDARRRQVPLLLDLHAVLAEYLNSLARLADGKAADISLTLEGRDKWVSEKTVLDARQVEAVTRLSELISKAALDHYRQRHIKRLIEQSKPLVDQVVHAMQFVVENAVLATLEDERIAADRYYLGLIRDAEIRGGQNAGIAALREWHSLRLEALQEKTQSAKRFQEQMQRFLAAHEKIHAQRNRLSAKMLAAHIQRYEKEMRNLAQAISALEAP